MGNPPYLGGKKISGAYGETFLSYLNETYLETGGLTDLVVYFLRRILSINNSSSYMGVITTNSISSGDSRKSGLGYLISNKNSTINFARRNIPWPGKANTNISLICLVKGSFDGKIYLDNKIVMNINSHLGSSEDLPEPFQLLQNKNLAYIGTGVHGQGFIIDGGLAEELINENSRNSEVVCKYISGADLNNNYDLSPSKWIINFRDWDLNETKKFTKCFEIIREKVYPEREKYKRKQYRERWWQFAEKQGALYESIKNNSRVLARTQASKHNVFEFLKNGYVYDQKIVVFTTESLVHYSILNSTFHEVWIWKYAGDLGGTTLNYSPTNILETFPFPKEYNHPLEEIGEAYHEHRRQLMLKTQLGLTKTYNLFHTTASELQQIAKGEESLEDKAFEKQFGKEAARLRKYLANTPGTISFNEAVAGILKLRELHVQMDQAVLEAYGWTDIQLRHDFYEVDYLPENDRTRLTIQPDARKEVLKRLLELNHKIHEEEVRAEAEAKLIVKAAKKPRKKTAEISPVAPGLFDLTMLESLSFPANQRDKIMVAAALSIVEKAGDLSSMDHLDALLLATHPEWCKAFVDPGGQKRLEAVALGVPADFFAKSNSPIMWKDCRDYLEKRQALQIDRSSNAQTIKRGESFAAVKTSLPGGVDNIVAVALEALKEVQKLRQKIDLASEGQKPVLQIFELQHQEYRLAA